MGTSSFVCFWIKKRSVSAIASVPSTLLNKWNATHRCGQCERTEIQLFFKCWSYFRTDFHRQAPPSVAHKYCSAMPSYALWASIRNGSREKCKKNSPLRLAAWVCVGLDFARGFLARIITKKSNWEWRKVLLNLLNFLSQKKKISEIVPSGSYVMRWPSETVIHFTSFYLVPPVFVSFVCLQQNPGIKCHPIPCDRIDL